MRADVLTMDSPGLRPPPLRGGSVMRANGITMDSPGFQPPPLRGGTDGREGWDL